MRQFFPDQLGSGSSKGKFLKDNSGILLTRSVNYFYCSRDCWAVTVLGLWIWSSGRKNGDLGPGPSGSSGGGGYAGARDRFQAISAPRHQLHAGGHQSAHLTTQECMSEDQEQVMGGGPSAGNTGGGLRAGHLELHSVSLWAGWRQSIWVVRDGQGKSQGDGERGQDVNGTGLAQGGKRIAQKEGHRFTGEGLWSTGQIRLTPQGNWHSLLFSLFCFCMFFTPM